jgi:hypothetical protein
MPRLLIAPRLPLALGAFFLTCSAPQLFAQDTNGESLNGIVNLSGGFLPDPHVVDIVPGGDTQVEDLGAGCSGYIYASQPDLKVLLDSASSQFGIFVNSNIDTTLVINDPNGGWHCNDDAEFLTNSNPGVLFNKPANGTYDIWVGTYSDVGTDSTGRLVITEWDTSDWASMDLGSSGTSITSDGIDFGDDLSTWANDGECDDPRFEGEGTANTLLEDDRYHDATDCSEAYSAGTIQLAGGDSSDSGGVSSELGGSQRGRLDETDPRYDSDGGYYDTYTFEGTAGSSAVVDLRSADFDTILQVTSPSGEDFLNDDYEGSLERSLVSFELTETGEYTIEVTSWGAGTGAYTLDMSTDLQSAPVDLQSSGDLASGDSTFSDGEYYDSYTFEGQPGQSVTIDLNSDDFDTYLVLETPDGQKESNDDAESTAHSQIVSTLSQVGTYTVYVTSYGAAETGDYVVSVTQGASGSGGGISPAHDSQSIYLGQYSDDALDTADMRSADGKYQDFYVFEGSAGQSVQVDMAGSFDTFLSIVAPSGQTFENDDYNGDTMRSLVEFTLPESGRYRIVATTYASDITGSYDLALNPGRDSPSNAIFLPSNPGGGQIYGIFAGISDYEGEGNDLPLTDQDALRARDAMLEGAGMNPNNAYTLLNADATIGNFTSAVNEIGSQIGPDDTLVIFYSGHGGQHDRSDGPNSTDPDGKDESIVLYDDYLMDDQLDAMLDNINAGRVLLVFDSCFSGGFGKDVIAAPGRMGLFSSEEDVTSLVADKFQAGGFLAVFFEDAVRTQFADGDMNMEVTAMELSEYIHERYRFDVKPEGSEASSARVTGPASVYQHLVVDRGGVSADSVLFYH